MPLDPLEERQLMRMAIGLLAEPLADSVRDGFIEQSVSKMNRRTPAPGKAQKRGMFTVHSQD